MAVVATETGVRFSKSTAEVYLLKGMPYCRWAKFTVEDLGTSGRLSVASDYGDWQNGWNDCGVGFKEFLCKLDLGYVARKFGVDRWFDAKRTVKAYRKDVLEYRRNDDITKEKARIIWDEIKELEDETGENSFTVAISHLKGIMNFYEYMPEFYRDIEPSFRYFWKEVWPLFVAELQKEQNV